MQNFVRRFVVTCAAVSVLSAGTGAAIAHGFAHHEAAEHTAEHAAAPHDIASIGGSEHDGDHPHAALTPAAPASVAKGSFAARAEQISLPSDEPVVVSDAAAAKVNESPPDTPGGSPTRARAPPVL